MQILYDFIIQYTNTDADGLLQKWDKYASSIEKVLAMEKMIVSTEWNKDVERFVALFKLLPASRGKSPVMSFIRVLERFMIHSEVSSNFQTLFW